MNDVVNVIDVLTRSAAARATVCQVFGAPDADVDLRLISDVQRTHGTIGSHGMTLRAVADTCAVLRSTRSHLDGAVSRDELARGLAAHADRLDGFAACGDARIDLVTLRELLEHPRGTSAHAAVTAQVRLLVSSLLDTMSTVLFGNPVDNTACVDPPLDARSGDPAEIEQRRVGNEVHDQVMAPPTIGPVDGVLAAAWRRDWAAVPILADRISDALASDAGIGGTLARNVEDLTSLLVVDRHPSRPWRVVGQRLELGDTQRDVRALTPETVDTWLATEPRPLVLVTDPTLAFALVEYPQHVAVLGPRPVVAALVGDTPTHAIAAFRRAVEELADDGDDPPADLLDVANRFGRYRRRSR